MGDTSDTLERLASRARQLYSLPAIAMRVLELTSNPGVDTRALKECIENDPALTGKILRVVNSSLFGLSREVSDLNQALALLGTKPLKLLVLGFSLPAGLFQGLEAETLGWYWRHTLTRAVAAREISENVWRQPGDEAFIAGLLQDLGLLLLIQELGPPYLDFLDKARRQGGDLAALETMSLGFDHATLTATLLEQWRLPENLVASVCPGRTERAGPLPPAARRLAEIVEVAELVAEVLVEGRAEPLERLLAAGLRDHALRREQLEELVEDLEDKVRQLADVLSLRLPEGADYVEVLRRAQAQLADAAAEAAEDLLAMRQGPSYNEQRSALAEEIERFSAAAKKGTGGAGCQPAGQVSDLPHEQNGATAPYAMVSRAATAPSREMATAGRLAVESPAAEEDADSALRSRLALAAVACRHARRPLSLLLAELPHVETLLLAYGPDGFAQLLRSLEKACRGLDHQGAICLAFREAGFAVILVNCERQAATGLGNQLLAEVRRFASQSLRPRHPSPSLGIGVASVPLPPPNFAPQDLFSAATRCLYGSHSSGGGVVKSIEIY